MYSFLLLCKQAITLIFPKYSPLPPNSPNPPSNMSVSAMNLTASMECPE